MATLGTSVNTTVKDLKSTLSLADGTTYIMQYRGPGILKVHTGSSAPSADTSLYFQLDSVRTASVIVVSGENIYAWTDAQEGSVTLDTVN